MEKTSNPQKTYYTDLALELATNQANAEPGTSLCSRSHSEYVSRGYTVSHAELDNGASYHTIISGKLWLKGEGDRRRCQSVLCDILAAYLTKAGFCLRSGRVLFCGLGNEKITSDAIGPMIFDRLLVSGSDRIYRSVGFTELYALKPGVPSQSGLSTGEQIRLTAEHIGADVIITADAIAARTTKRLASVIQVSDCGVRAGSGAGRRSDEISTQTMPCRVISIGIPTVIRSSVMIGDSLREIGGAPYELSEKEEFLVSNSETDIICDCYADIVSGAINRTFTAEIP